MKMRDGTKVDDPRLGRLVLFDEKSKAFPIIATLGVEQQQPRSYTWSCGLHYDQGQTEQCVSYSWHHELAARPVVQLFPLNTVDMQLLLRDRYWQMQRDDPWPGGQYPGASPKYGGTAVLAGAKLMQALGYFSEYRWAFGIHDLILAVGYKGPAVLGIPWKTQMFGTDEKGFIHATGSDEGGHAILCKGVSVRNEYFTLHNSWGDSWGVNGSAKISFADMDKLLEEDGEACIPVLRKRVANA